MLSAAKTASNALVNRESRSRSRNLMEVTRSPRSISRLRGGLGGPLSGRLRAHLDQMRPARTMLDCDQCVNPPEHHRIHRHEVHGQDSLGLGDEELSPARTEPPRCGVDAGVVEGSLPHGGGGDVMAEPDQFALHAPVAPGRVLCCHAHHKFRDRRRDRGDVPGDGVRCRPPCAPPACGARPGSWRE
jgi:hypothetical protein